MSFRCRQKIKLAPSGSVYETEQVTLESGQIIDRVTDTTKEVLPKPELFDLKAQLKAGVNLEEVNSRILSSSHVDIGKVLTKAIKQSKKAPQEPEVNDEG